jgi:branched-chain amino acid transport system permease protein
VITTGVTRYYRQHFAAIKENQVLAESLGLVVWRYKMFGFVAAAGLAGITGFSLLNMLLTAHPSSFSAMSSVNYIAYAIVGGATSMVGPIVGTTVLVWATNIFSNRGEYSPGLFGLLIALVVLVAKGGIVGSVIALAQRLRIRQETKLVPVSPAVVPASTPATSMRRPEASAPAGVDTGTTLQLSPTADKVSAGGRGSGT